MCLTTFVFLSILMVTHIISTLSAYKITQDMITHYQKDADGLVQRLLYIPVSQVTLNEYTHEIICTLGAKAV